MKLKKPLAIFKVTALFLLAVVGFHFSGIETAFCKDNVEVPTSKSLPNDHGCLNCQPSHHVAIQGTSFLNLTPIPPIGFAVDQSRFLTVKDLSFSFFRPPIFA